MFFQDFSIDAYKRKIKRRFITLLVPYLAWNTIWMIFNWILSFPFFERFLIGRKGMSEVTIENIIHGIVHYKYNGPFWFLFCLIVFCVFSPVLFMVIKKRYLGLIVIASILPLKLMHIGLPWPLFDSPYSIYYFMIGGYVGYHYYPKFIIRRKKEAGIATIGLLLLILFFILTYRGVLVENEIAYVLACTVGVFCIWRCFDVWDAWGVFSIIFI